MTRWRDAAAEEDWWSPARRLELGGGAWLGERKSKTEEGRRKWGGEHRALDFMHKVRHAPYFVRCMTELASPLNYFGGISAQYKLSI